MSDKMSMAEMAARIDELEKKDKMSAVAMKEKDEELKKMTEAATKKKVVDDEAKAKQKADEEKEMLTKPPTEWSDNIPADGKKIDLTDMISNIHIIIHKVEKTMWQFQICYDLLRPDGTIKHHKKNIMGPHKDNADGMCRYSTWMYNHGLFGPESVQGEGTEYASEGEKKKKYEPVFESPEKKKFITNIIEKSVGKTVSQPVFETVARGGAGDDSEVVVPKKKKTADEMIAAMKKSEKASK